MLLPGLRAAAQSEDEGAPPDYVQVRVLLDRDAYHPGETARVAIEFKIDSRVHINSNQPTEEYQYPTSLTWGDDAKPQPSAAAWPKAVKKAFEFTEGAKIAVFEGTQRATFTVAVPGDAKPGEIKLSGSFKAQGCTHSTCYAPQTDEFDLVLKVVAAGAATKAINADAFAASATEPSASETASAGSEATTPPATEVAVIPPVEPPPVDGPPPVDDGIAPVTHGVPQPPDGGPKDSMCEVATQGKKANRSLLVTFLLAFLGGIALTFTPCVLPLVPITIGYFSRQRQAGRPIVPATLYVLGLALVYSALGTAAALTGGLFGAALQMPLVLGLVSALLLYLALSMFGIVPDLQLPAGISNRIGGGRAGGLGAMFMGGAMGLVAAPCVGPFVVTLLTYVAELGSRMPKAQAAFVGGALFFTLALGLGLPFFLVALGVGTIRPGEWMVSVKKVFGFVILGVVLWFLRPVFGSMGSTIFRWGIVAVLAAAAIYFFIDARKESYGRLARNLLRGVATASGLAAAGALVFCIMLLTAHHTDAATGRAFEPYSEQALAEATRQGKPVIIDFGADWCIACKELEHQTFPNAEVQKAFEGFVLLHSDQTHETDENVAIYKQLKVRGLPTIVFLDPQGREIQELRLTGFEKAEKFVERLRCVSTLTVAQK